MRHAETLYQCDFFSKRIWTKFGLQQCWVLVLLHLSNRKVFVTQCTRKPTATWKKEQATKFIEHVKASGRLVTLFLRNRDGITHLAEIRSRNGILLRGHRFPYLNSTRRAISQIATTAGCFKRRSTEIA